MPLWGYANVVWFHASTARLAVLGMTSLVAFQTLVWGYVMLLALLLTLVDAVYSTVMRGVREHPSTPPGFSEVWPHARRYFIALDVAGWLATLGAMGWAIWAKPWWPAKVGVSAVLVLIAGVGLVASVVMQVQRRDANDPANAMR